MSHGLQHEIHKKRPFDIAEEETYLSILRTHSLLTNATERFLRDYGLSMATYNVLRILRAAGSEGKTCSQVGLDMVALVPDVTRLVDRLERASLVTRTRSHDDRRVVRVAITEQGLTLLAKVDQPLVELYRSQLGHMTREEHAQISSLLYKARHAHGPDPRQDGHMDGRAR